MSIQALAWVIEKADVTLGARCLLFAIANHADEHGRNCWASVDTLAKEARLSRRATQGALRKMETAEVIEGVGTSEYGTTIYDIKAMKPGGEEAAPVHSETMHEGEDDDTGGAKKATDSASSTSPKPSSEPSSETECELFDYWVAAMGLDPARTRFTDERRQKVRARLRDNYTPDDIKWAIHGCARSDFHMKRGDYADRDGAKHNDLTLICRNGSTLERFRQMGQEDDGGAPSVLPHGIPLV